MRDIWRKGIKGLGQPLKSFRDSEAVFPPYHDGAVSADLNAPGSLSMPASTSRGKDRA